VHEYRLIRSDGEIIWIRDNCAATRHPSGALQLDGVLTDVTAHKQAEVDQRKLEERIQQTQKLESIGVLAGGIAHDFNNLLVVIMGNADLAVSSANCPSHIHGSLQEIETAAQRASELCRELLVYSGRAPYVTLPIDLGELVQEMEKLLRLANSPGVRIEFDSPEESALIDGDAAQLRQLVMNLITNAVDSMKGDPGRIQISIEERWCEEADFANTYTHESLPAGRYVLLSVSDTGCGMAEETLLRIFDPFFTTKFTGRGLGLAAALGIIRGHHGAISVTSELGVGTRTLVHFPALVKTHARSATGGVKAAAWKTSGVVLIVDDEESVRRVGSLMLERLGVKVVSVASGEEALRIMDSGAHNFCCVILDLMMPGLSGTDTLCAIRKRNQNLPVLIVTGYGESDASDLLGELSATGLLAKPFTSEQLGVAVRAALGE
jgi:signal transduction histidine kinase/CheY-like chemotaxis protein